MTASPIPTDRFAAARSVADAVLYEGYVLYPYRASSRKNQVRFQWGVLTPRAFSETEGSERSAMRAECLLDPGTDPVLSVRIRCLQVQHRSVEAQTVAPRAERGSPLVFEPVDSLAVEGTLHTPWDEAVDQVIDLSPLAIPRFEDVALTSAFTLEAGTSVEALRSAGREVAGRFVRRREQVQGAVHVATERPDPRRTYVKVTVAVENTTTWSGPTLHRDDAMGKSLVAVHIMLAVDGGRFISLLDPPDDAVDPVAACHSDGVYPVLIGDEKDVVLASPIILYDRPEVAPQSPGDLYDSLEIDEILALRVMTLTDDEKSEARGTDSRAAAIIDRCDDMSAETLSRLHGQMRPVSPVATELDLDQGSSPAAWWDPAVDAAVDPWTDTIVLCGVTVTKGTPVRLRPSQRSDAQDMFLRGLCATVTGVFQSVDGETHVAVTLDDDPASAELVWQGRYLFFHPDEIEPLLEQGQRP
jgi:hypothetical protein